MRWYEDFPARWATERRIAKELLEEVHHGNGEDGHAFVRGLLHVLSQRGHEYDTFQIKIVYPEDFPQRGRVPSVYLESHRDRWRTGRDSHIERDWKLCLFVPGDSGIDFEQPASLRDLIACLHTFLIKERIYQRDLLREALTGNEAQWPGEDRSHGMQGIVEVVHERGRFGRNEPCPCGSGKKYKKCCQATLER